ncbi:MAG: hypothetical protein HYX34_02730 [Actinobacteria bacterium]|nr:hypothetical protein [Actinomycetota bacterium]
MHTTEARREGSDARQPDRDVLGAALDSAMAESQYRTAAASVAREMSVMPPAADHIANLEAAARI